ncbi:MAG: glycosyltransferase family 4 protein [Micromonosporaceae bacterium]
MSTDIQRVAFVLGTTAGGTGTHVRTLAAGLAARGIEVSVFGPAATGELPGLSLTPVEIADRPRPVRDIAAVARLRRLLRQRAPAVVHAHGLRAGALTAIALRSVSLAGPPARRAKRAVFLVTVHNAPPVSGGVTAAIYGILERIVARAADRVLCVSGDLADRMRRRGARSIGPAVVPAPALPGVSAALLARGADPPGTPRTPAAVRASLGAAGRPLVLAAGRLAAQKGFGTLLDAAALLRGHQARPLVVIAGDGPLRAQLAGRIDTERLPLRCLGRRDDIPALLGAADVFVLPSVWEGQPLILQEALRAGAAIVATRTGGIPALTGEDAALLVPPGDPQRLAAAISRVLDEPGLAARLRAAAAERGRSLPGEEEAVDAVLTDYRMAAAAKAAHRAAV